MNTENNPAAFPSGSQEMDWEYHGNDDEKRTTHTAPINEGMSLRDYFAAKAMQSLLPMYGDNFADRIVSQSYYIADLMIKARGNKS